MKYKKYAFTLLSGAVIFILALLALLSHNIAAFASLLLIALLITPFTNKIILTTICPTRPDVCKFRILTLLLFVLIAIICFQHYSRQSIFDSGTGKDQLIEIYDSHLRHWYTTYNSIYLKTSYGDVHLLISGDPDNPPAILLPATNLAAWSFI
ncbi:MAG: hypothetical protein K9M99_10710 [Candidatus Cloacimonetes bacterium]|nr:hypothetical protein [Candidatus Cloacimonadota bacterium]